MNEFEQWMTDQLRLEHEAIEALDVISKAGFVKEAETLALVSGLSSLFKPAKPRSVAHIEFP